MIRLVRRADLIRVRDIFVSLFDAEYARRGVDIGARVMRYRRYYPLLRVLSWFPNPLRYTLNIHVVEAESRICGFIQTAPGNRQQSRWHIDFVAVAPESHGQGLGRELVGYVMDRYGRQGVMRFTLEVDHDNQGARRFYEKLGFHTYAVNTYYRVDAQPDRHPARAPEAQPAHRRWNEAIYQLYVACTPAVVRLVDGKEPVDFAIGMWDYVLNGVRRCLKHRDDLRYVFCDGGHVVGYLRIMAQYRQLPHTLQLMVHPGYESLYDVVLAHASAVLSEFPKRPVLAWAPDYQPAKQKALREWGMSEVASDHCLVRHNLLATQTEVAEHRLSAEDGLFKPAYTNRV